MERFKNKVLLLDESNFEQVKKLLIDKGFKINSIEFKIRHEKTFAWLGKYSQLFMTSHFKLKDETELTLEEFINLLNE